MADVMDELYEVADKLLALRDEEIAVKKRDTEIPVERAQLIERARALLTDAVVHGDVNVKNVVNGTAHYTPEPFARKFESVPTPTNLTKSTIRNQVINYFREHKGEL